MDTQQAQADLVDPFDGDSKTFEVTHEVNVDQIQREISERLGQQVQVALNIEFGMIASKGNPGVLFVSPGSVDGRTVRAVVESHKPRKVLPKPEPKQDGIFVPNTPEVAAAKKKLADGDRLTTSEISDVLRVLLDVDTPEG